MALSGILVVSNPASVGIYGGTFAVRVAGSTWEAGYGGQLCAVNTTGWHPSIGYFGVYPPSGDRKPVFTTVLISESREFDFKYTLQYPPGGIPQTPGKDFQINICVPMWWGNPDLFPYAF